MNHSFNTRVAADFDIESAVFLENMVFWLDQNLCNKRHIYDNHVWTFNSYKAFGLIFHYFSHMQIRRIVEKLIKNNLIIKANYNIKNYDKTSWYTLTDKALDYFPVLKDKISTIFSQLKNPGADNTYVETDQPIPDINTNIKKDINNIYIVDFEKSTTEEIDFSELRFASTPEFSFHDNQTNQDESFGNLLNGLEDCISLIIKIIRLIELYLLSRTSVDRSRLGLR